MIRITSLMVCACVALFARADDTKKWEAPIPPKGWKTVTSSDGTYVFALPKESGRSGSRDHSFS